MCFAPTLKIYFLKLPIRIIEIKPLLIGSFQKYILKIFFDIITDELMLKFTTPFYSAYSIFLEADSENRRLLSWHDKDTNQDKGLVLTITKLVFIFVVLIVIHCKSICTFVVIEKKLAKVLNFNWWMLFNNKFLLLFHV